MEAVPMMKRHKTSAIPRLGAGSGGMGYFPPLPGAGSAPGNAANACMRVMASDRAVSPCAVSS